MGLPVSVFSSAAGPEELQYVPADAAVVAYANVRDVHELAVPQAVHGLEPSQDDKNEFEEKTGLNFEQDVDSVVAAVMPKDGMAKKPAGSFLILARGRYQAARLEALALEHGATGQRLPGQAPHHVSRSNDGNDDRRETWPSASSRPTWSRSAASNQSRRRSTRALEPQHRLEQRNDEAGERDRQRQRVGGRQVRRHRQQGRSPG